MARPSDPEARRPKKRGTSNQNERGNTRQRAARRAWLMKAWACDLPGYVRCYRCGRVLGGIGADELTIDRIIPGCKGGTYARNNIRPACMLCNRLTGGGQRR